MAWWPGGYDKVALRGWDVELVEVALAGGWRWASTLRSSNDAAASPRRRH